MIRDPTKVFEQNLSMTKYFPAVLRNMSCDDPEICKTHSDKLSYQWFMTTCMNRRHYHHMLEEVKYLQEVYKQVKTTFYQAISHVSEKSKEGRAKTRENLAGVTRQEALYLKDQILLMAGGKVEQEKRIADWLAMIGLEYGVYSNAKDIKTIKKSIKTLQEARLYKRQDRNIHTIAVYLSRTINRVRLHDVMLRKLRVKLLRLEYNLMGQMHLTNYNTFATMILRDAGFTMSRLIAGLTSATQNVEAVYNYLRVMSSHKLDPTVVLIPQLIQISRIEEFHFGGLYTK